ncbi:MAG: glycine betaine ABC transporter substrate-binding protein, partial [Ilumatobacteraceae bacterium]
PATTEAEPEATEPATTEAAGTDGGESAGGEISLAWIPWEENIANTNLWAEILENEGYDVTMQQLDVAPTFQAVADGDRDIFLDVWLPGTHAQYWDEFGEQVEDLGSWYDEATLELSVPAYVDEVDSLADLADNADLFDGEIIGIEAGAGMMGLLRDDVVPAYGLDDWTVVESSTPAMRTELQAAYENEEPIVVTLWSPHPEYADKDLKKLEDPEGAWGDAEQLHAIARPGFSEEFPEVATWIENFEMTFDQIHDLEGRIADAGEGNERQAAAEWIEANQDVVDGWLTS